MRKTFGYHMYQQTHDAVTLKDIFNHSHMSETLRYIGINQDNKDKAIMGLTFKKGGRRYEGKLVPKVWADEKDEVKKVRLTSRPLPRPFDVYSWTIIYVKGEQSA